MGRRATQALPATKPSGKPRRRAQNGQGLRSRPQGPRFPVTNPHQHPWEARCLFPVNCTVDTLCHRSSNHQEEIQLPLPSAYHYDSFSRVRLLQARGHGESSFPGSPLLWWSPRWAPKNVRTHHRTGRAALGQQASISIPTSHLRSSRIPSVFVYRCIH